MYRLFDMGGMLIVLISALAFLIVAVVLYICHALVHMRALKELGFQNPWMAWVPILNFYALAKSIEEEETTNVVADVKVPTTYFNWWIVVAIIVNFIPVIGNILLLAMCLLCQGYVYKQMFSRLEKKDEAQVQTIAYVSGLIPIVGMLYLARLQRRV